MQYVSDSRNLKMNLMKLIGDKNNKQKLAEEEDLRKCVEKNQQNDNFKEF